MAIVEEENHLLRSSSILLIEEQMRRVEVPGDGSCLFWAVALPYLIQVNNNIKLFSEIFERLFGEKELIHSHHVRRLINEFHTSHHVINSIYDDEILRRLVTQVFRHKLVDLMNRCEDQFYESISVDDFKDMKNESFITDGTFRDNFEKDFSHLIEESEIDLDKLKLEILDENAIEIINKELDKLIKLGWGDLLQRFKFRMYLEAMRSCGSWGGNHEIEMMKRMLECEILVNFENRLVSVLENSIICLFNKRQIHYHFVLIRAQFLIEFIDQNSEEDSLVYLNIGVDEINYQNSNGSTLLHFAAKNNHLRLIHLLVNQGAKTNIKNHLGQTPLDVATLLNSHSSINALNLYIKQDLLNLDSKPKHITDAVSELKLNNIDRTELCTPVEDRNNSDLRQLPNLEQDEHHPVSVVDAPIREGLKQTESYLAAKHNRAVEMHLESKAEVNVRDENRECSPLHYAAERGHLDILKLLIEKGKAEIDVPDSIKGSPLQRAVRFGQLSAVKYLVGVGADVNSKDQTSISVLSYAAKAGCFNTVHFLVEKGADINAADENSITPLHHAAKSSRWNIVKYLVERGADPNIKNRDSKTALMKVVKAGQWGLAKLLIENGAFTEGLTEKQIDEVLKRNFISLEGEDVIFNLIVLGNSELLENQINKLEENNPNFLNDVLPEIYEEIQLLNIPIFESVSYIIESQIVKCRLFSDRKLNETSLNIEEQVDENIQLRINAVVDAIKMSEAINAIVSENAINETFFFLLKLIARNIQLLKNVEHHKLPWIEMQFCLVNFISSFSAEPKHNDLIYKIVLNKARLMKHLRLFRTELENLGDTVKSDSKHRFTNRSQIIDSVLKFNSSFKDLYEDYELLRDVYSLNRIESYLNPACLVGFKEGDVLVGEQVILRALQVTGECLKNTIESPNVSDKVHNLLIALAPKNVTKIVTSVRDSLSHVEHLHKVNEAENQSSLLDIQKDLIKLKEEITFISLLKRNFALETFFKRIHECENIKQAKEIIVISGVQVNEVFSFQPSDKQNEVFNQVVELTIEYEKEIQTPNDDQLLLFKKLRNVVAKNRRRLEDVFQKHVGNFQAGNSLANLIKSDGEINLIRRNAKSKIIQLNLQLEKIDANVYVDIFDICFDVYSSLNVKDRNNNINLLFMKIYQMTKFEAQRVKSINRFKTKMSKELNYVDEIEKTKEIEGKVNNILQNISKEILDSEVKKQFLNKIEIKKEVYQSKNTLIDYYSKVNDIRTKIVRYYYCFQDVYVDAIKFFNVYKLMLTNGTVNADTIDGLLCEFNLRVFRIFLEKIQIGDLDEINLEKINFETIFNEFYFDKLIDDEKLIDKNLFKIVLEEIRKNEFDISKKVVDDEKAFSLINEIELFKPLIEKIKQDLSLDESSFSAHISNVQLKLKKGETYETLFNDFSSSKCKTILNSLKRNDGKLDSFGKLVKDVSKELEITKLIEPFSEFIRFLNIDISKEIIINIEKAIETVKNQQIVRLRKFFFEKLETLSNVFPSDKSDLELLFLLKSDNIRLAVEMLVLNLTETLNELSHFEPNRFYLDEFSPVLVGKNLRNYLAHGDPLINIISTNYLISLISHFRLFQRNFHKDKEFYLGNYLIGKVNIENLLQVKHNFQQKIEFFLNKKEKLLHISKNSKVDEFSQLIDNPFHLKVQSALGMTLLHLSAKTNNLGVFQHLLEHGLSLFYKDLSQRSVLRAAVTAGSKQIIEFLLEKGFESSFIVEKSDTLVHLAVQYGHLHIVKLLLRHGADIEAVNNQGIKPIMRAVIGGHKDIVIELINAGVDLESRDKIGRTLLHLATSNVEITKILIERNVNINAIDNGLRTPLHLACRNGEEAIVQMLLDNEANINSKTKSGETALHLAAAGGHVKVVEVLLVNKKVEIDAVMDGRYTALHLACFPGHFDVAELLLKHGADFNLKNIDDTNALHIASWRGHIELLDILFDYPVEVDGLSNGKTALHIAVESGETKAFRKLFEKGANIFVKDLNGRSVLHFAARSGSVEMMELILQTEKLLGKLELVNMTDATGLTALHWAVSANQIKCVNFLLENKADVEAKSFKQKTPLLLAALRGHSDICNILLNKGANILAKDHTGWSALHFAAQSNNTAIITKLIQRKVNVNAKSDDDGRTALQLAAQSGNLETANLLLKNGADIRIADANCWSALHWAASFQHAEIVDYLLKNKRIKLLLVNGREVRGRTALHLSAYNGHLEVMKSLIENRANVNASDNDGWTPLHFAAEGGHVHAVKYLLINGAKINLKAEKDGTALHIAADKGFSNIVKEILGRDESEVDVVDDKNQTPLFRAARNGHCEIVRFLLNKNADVNAPDHTCFTPLHAAAVTGDVETVRLLLNNGADVELLSKSHLTPLHLAALCGQVGMAIELIKFGADVNRKEIQHSTPLHVAVKHNKAGVVGYFLTLENIEVNVKEIHGATPLHLAAQCGFLDIAQMLITAGADVNSKNRENFTPLHRAMKGKNCQLVNLLVEKGADVNAIYLDDGTALESAVLYGLINAVETLLEKGANITDFPIKFAAQLKFFDIFMKLVQWGGGGSEGTALHKAIKCKNEPILTLIFGVLVNEESRWSSDQLNSVMNAVDGDGRTPLISAAENGYSYAVHLLLLLSGKSVKMNEQTKDGRTALHLSALNGHEKTVEMLISKQADANLKDLSGRTAFDLVNEKIISEAEKFQLIAALLLSVTN